MKNEADNFWADVAADLARACDLGPLTPEEAEREFESLPPGQFSNEEVDSVVGQVLAAGPAVPPADSVEEPAGMELVGADADAVEEKPPTGADVTNADEERRLERLRQDALEDELAEPTDGSAQADEDSEEPK